MMTRSEAQRLLDAIMLELLSANPELPTDTVRRLFDAGELRVGLEILCDNLVEAGIALNNRAKTDIESIGLFLGMPSDYWRDIITTQPTP
jgi:hypothetical protein